MTALHSGDRVACTVGPTNLTGTYITDRAGMRVVKLDSGYNIGVDPDRVSFLERIPAAPAPAGRDDGELGQVRVLGGLDGGRGRGGDPLEE